MKKIRSADLISFPRRAVRHIRLMSLPRQLNRVVIQASLGAPRSPVLPQHTRKLNAKAQRCGETPVSNTRRTPGSTQLRWARRRTNALLPGGFPQKISLVPLAKRLEVTVNGSQL